MVQVQTVSTRSQSRSNESLDLVVTQALKSITLTMLPHGSDIAVTFQLL
jgi:hypothetical protein